MILARTLRPVASAGEKLLDRTLCVVGAVLGTQLPEFMQQYLQRLGGHLDEARRQLEIFARVAREAGMTLPQLTERLSANADPAMARMGGVVRDAAARVDELAAAESALRHASLWSRPFVFLRHLDGGIAHNTWTVFRPAVPTTIEGLVYAAVGMMAVMALYQLAVVRPFRSWQQARAGRSHPPAPPPAAPAR